MSWAAVILAKKLTGSTIKYRGCYHRCLQKVCAKLQLPEQNHYMVMAVKSFVYVFKMWLRILTSRGAGPETKTIYKCCLNSFWDKVCAFFKIWCVSLSEQCLVHWLHLFFIIGHTFFGFVLSGPAFPSCVFFSVSLVPHCCSSPLFQAVAL